MRSTVCDLQRGEVHLIPNSLEEVLRNSRVYFDSKIDSEIGKAIEYLVENELGFFTESPEDFPKLDLGYEYPGIVSNAIVEVSEFSNLDFEKLFFDFGYLGIKCLELRVYYPATYDTIEKILELLRISRIHTVTVYIKYGAIERDKFQELMRRFPRLKYVVVFNSEHEEINHISSSSLIFTKSMLTNRCCGKIHQNVFASNIKMFSESQIKNTCLNGKVAIDSNGLVRNCPSMGKSFGKVGMESLINIVKSQGFQSLWNIRKDDVSVCRECEFRHVCSDCRAYIEDPDDHYSKPLKCGYDPYRGVWEDWATNPLKQKAIEHYFGKDQLPSP